jgi:fructoselysine-6-phosphate deglycase
MLKFDEAAKIQSVNGALALRPQINEAVDALCQAGYKNICWLGIGGTLASAWQAVVHMKERTALEVFSESAAEYLTTGNKRVGPGTTVIFSSVSGTTGEIVAAIEKMKANGATVLGFVDNADSPLARLSDKMISYPENEQLKFFMVADRFMQNAGEFEDYDRYYAEMDAHLAQALVDVEKKADAFALEFAQKHHNDALHYFVGAGNQWGATYSYAMCYWEEQHWLKTKSIHASEFFHGTFEIIERDVPVTVFIGEDSQRSLSERVVKFLPQICGNYTFIDTKDYELAGISPEYRGTISHLVMHAVNNRIDIHIEHINRHPLDIRRYYRQLDY